MNELTRFYLITQLRVALGELESPLNDEVEFDIADTTFNFAFDENDIVVL